MVFHYVMAYCGVCHMFVWQTSGEGRRGLFILRLWVGFVVNRTPGQLLGSTPENYEGESNVPLNI